MRAFFSERVLPFVLLFVALVSANALGMLLVFQHGFAFSVSPVGMLLQIPITAALAAATYAILTRVKKLPEERIGFALDRRSLAEGALAAGAAVLTVGVLTAVLWSLAVLDVSWTSRPLASLWVAVPIGILASLVNAFLQQLGLQGIALAVGTEGKASWGAVGFSVLLFVATHASESQAPLYLANVALFGVLTALLFFRGARPSYAAPVGLHGGWNAAMIFLGLVPGAEEVALCRATGHDELFGGGAVGIEGGLPYLLVMGGLLVGAVGLRRLAPGR